MKIFYHADDFGIAYEQSKSILECYHSGMLNSISIILNSPQTLRSFELITDLVRNNKMRCVAHLNFVEGKNVSTDTPHLTDSNGYFNCTFSSLLKASFGINRIAIKNELIREIDAQLKIYSSLIQSNVISIDSHQHFHMIPIVWESLSEVISKNGYTVEYIRIPIDPIQPIIKKKYFFKIKPINYVKWGVLKLLQLINTKHAIPIAKVPTFFGIPFTCEMNTDVLSTLLPEYEQISKESNTDLEIMFHLGAIKNAADLLDKNNQQLVEFYGSAYRDSEKECLLQKQYLRK